MSALACPASRPRPCYAAGIASRAALSLPRPGRSPRPARGSKPRLRPGFSAVIERLPSRGQPVRFPRLSRYSRGLLRSPRPSAGLRSLARDPLAAAGSLTPSGERLKAPAAPGLFRGDGEITVKGSKCQGWSTPPQARGWVCGSRHKFPHRLFFCGCRLSAAAAGSHPPQKFPRWSQTPASKGMGVRKQAQISPPPFFLRLSPVGGSGWKPSPPSGSKIHRAAGGSAVRAAAATAKAAAAGVQLVGLQQERRQIHRRRY